MLGIYFSVCSSVALAEELQRNIWLFNSQYSLSQPLQRELRRPQAVEMDNRGNIFIADSGNDRVVKLDGQLNTEAVTTGWGSERDLMNSPSDIACDAGLNIYVTDYQNGRIVRLDNNLNYLWSAKLSSFDEQLEFPLSIALSPWGELFVLEENLGRVIKLEPLTSNSSIIGGNRPAGKSLFGGKRIAVDSTGNLFIAVPGDNSVLKYDVYGNFISQIQVDVTPATLDWGDGYLWIAGKDELICLKDTVNIAVNWIDDENPARGIVDIAVNMGKLVILTDEKPCIRQFLISKSPSGIEW